MAESGTPEAGAGLALGWLLAAALAVTVGVVAVTRSVRACAAAGRWATRWCAASSRSSRRGRPEPAPGGADDPRRVRRDRRRLPGPYALGLDARPDRAAGWRVVSYETGPDDDVDAVFANRDRSIELEVFCNRGEPTVGDLERNTLPD